MKISAAFPSKYLKVSDLQDRNVTVVMSHVELKATEDAEDAGIIAAAEDGMRELREMKDKRPEFAPVQRLPDPGTTPRRR